MSFIASPRLPVVHKKQSSADSAVFLDFCLQIEKKKVTLKRFLVVERA